MQDDTVLHYTNITRNRLEAVARILGRVLERLEALEDKVKALEDEIGLKVGSSEE